MVPNCREGLYCVITNTYTSIKYTQRHGIHPLTKIPSKGCNNSYNTITPIIKCRYASLQNLLHHTTCIHPLSILICTDVQYVKTGISRPEQNVANTDIYTERVSVDEISALILISEFNCCATKKWQIQALLFMSVCVTFVLLASLSTWFSKVYIWCFWLAIQP